MSAHTAFEISEIDVEVVLRAHRERIVSPMVRSFDALAQSVYGELTDEDFGRIEKAALDSGTDMDEQTDGAHDELRTILSERGILLSESVIPA